MTVDRVRAVLADAGLPVTLSTLEDCLWLACRLPAETSAPDGSALGGEETPAEIRVPAPPNPADDFGQETGRPEGASEPVAALHASNPRPQGEGPVRKVRAPAAPMLGKPLSLQRALRPLKVRVPSREDTAIDEEATAARIADTGQWDPVMTGVPERWLDLVLVADTSPSMALWRPMVHELDTAFRQTGAFRDVRLTYLSNGEIVNARNSERHVPATLVDPAGRRVVLVFSDCAGGHWWRGEALTALRTWARHGPTAILQPLPEHMWQRTAAPAVTGWAVSRWAGAPNSMLGFTADLTAAPLDQGIIPVPVLELAPSWLKDWAELVAGPERGRKRAAVACLPPGTGTAQTPLLDQEVSLGPRERVHRFQASASPEAVRLAAHFAVSVLALPVMRHIQRRMVPDSKPSHLAEVLLSGLLRPTGQDRYDFISEEARLALLTALPRSESWQTIRVLREVSAEIERTAGSARTTFHAWLEELNGGPAGPGGTRFALVSRTAVDALRNLAIPLRPQPAPEPERQRPRPAVRQRDADLDRPMFFLSYARSSSNYLSSDSDSAGSPVQVFFKDLSRRVSDLSQERNPGFMDVTFRSGSPWSDQFARALGGCRVFVPLLSPGYFTSEWCRKEWGAFQQRVSRSAPPGENCIVPALWTGRGQLALPDAVTRINLTGLDTPPRYAELGLSGLAGLASYRKEYDEVVLALARTIVDVAERAPLRAGPPVDWHSAPDAFAGDRERAVRIAIVTAPTARPFSEPGYYGRSEWDWAPFPDAANSASLYSSVKSAVAGLGLQTAQSAIDNLRNDGPGLLFIDPWAADEPDTRETLTRFDQRRLAGIGVIVPFNLEDAATAEAQTRLADQLRKLLTHTQVHYVSAGSAVQFAEKLRETVTETITNYRRGGAYGGDR